MTAAMAANGDLELLEPIAEGGVGVVYRGRLGATPVAVKIVRDELSGSEPVRELMRTEAAVLRALAHPGIVSLIELRDDGDPILVLEWLPGCALHEVGSPNLPLGRALRIIDQLLAALACVHDRGFVHGDVKPSNMIVDPARGDRVTLIDFGLAAAVGVAPDRGPAGTVGFAAPEVFAGAPPRASADVYSAGVVLLSLLGGPVSPGVGSAAPTTRDLGGHPPRRGALAGLVPGALEALLVDALDPDPQRRPANAGVMRAKLRAAIAPRRRAPRAHATWR